jgi:hypothetical protein
MQYVSYSQAIEEAFEYTYLIVHFHKNHPQFIQFIQFMMRIYIRIFFTKSRMREDDEESHHVVATYSVLVLRLATQAGDDLVTELDD